MRTKPTLRLEADPGQVAEAMAEPGAAATPEQALSIKLILVPVDFSKCSLKALGYALEIARHFGSRLTLLHVMEPALHPDSYLAAPAFEDTNQTLLEAARERLKGIREKVAGGRLGVETLVRMGRAYSEIPDTAKALGADMVILGTNGYTGMKHILLGSTAERVVRNAPCPVLTVRCS